MTTPSDLLSIAETIQASISDETGQRTCINRAYYAIFHTASEIDQKLELPYPSKPEKGSSHQDLYNRLTTCLPSNSDEWMKVRSLGYSAIKVLKPARVHADYQLSEPIPHKMPEEIIAKAAKILRESATIQVKKPGLP